MAFEKFNKRPGTNGPALTVRKNGCVAFNSYAVKEFPIQDKQYATLHFDKEEMLIGIQLLAHQGDSAAFKICPEKGKIPTIYCREFLGSYGIPFNKGSRTYPATWDPDREMIIIRLS